MKKFLIIIGLFCGFIGNSWAECVLTESTDRTPSNEDLYPQNPYNESRMALICETGKCGDGEVVFAKAGHYRKDTKINEDVYYKCKLALDDRWVRIDPNETSTPCNDDEIDNMDVVNDWEDGIDLGRKQADNLYTGVCWKKYEFDNLCGVECNSQTVDKIIYCDNDIATCNRENQYKYVWRGYGYNIVGVMCPYTDPKTRDVGNYTVSMDLFVDSVDGQSWAKLFGTRKLENGQDLGNPKDFCIGCDAGFYSGGDWGCYNNEDKAWCYWRKNKENKNTEWKDGACNCLDSGMKWDTEKHDCVKKKGSGRTGGKTGSAASDTKCGIKCDSNMFDKPILCMGNDDSVVFYCDKDTKKWRSAYPRAHTCPYSDPERPNVAGLKFLYADDDMGKFYSDNNVKNGDVLTKEYRNAHSMCWVCPEGNYYDIALDDDFFVGVGDGVVAQRCIDNKEKAWCDWRQVNDKMNVKWEENTCKCLDSGKKWDTISHTCVSDGAGKGDKKPQQPKNDKINCSFNLGAAVKCRDGVQFSKNVSVSVSAETCDMYKAKVSKYVNEIAQLLCESRGGVDNVLTDAQVKNAADDLDRFFTNTEANASVWKNAEGKFNTARLASDATAGVILGTVGGIVSANIIKKKQVEKGFDALNCTIGGQKVADWGDEFTVGLHR